MGCGFPSSGTFIRFAINSDIPIAPLLLAQPFNGGMDAQSFSVATIIEAARAIFGRKHGDLSECISMWNVIIVNEFAATTADYIGWRGFVPWRTIREIWTDDGNDGDFLAFLGVPIDRDSEEVTV